MNKFLTPEPQISNSSIVPKYKQVAQNIIERISTGELKAGDKLPSISQSSIDFLLARDTIGKAYSKLQEDGFIYSVYRNGFFVTSKSEKLKVKVCLITGEITEAVKNIYNSLLKELDAKVKISIYLHKHKESELKNILDKCQLQAYQYYIVFPNLFIDDADTSKLLKEIPPKKLILIDKQLQGIQGNYSCFYKDLFSDFQEIYTAKPAKFKSYKNFNLVLPEEYFPFEVITSFKLFCKSQKLEYCIKDGIEDGVSKGNLYFIISEIDLVNLIKVAERNNLKIGEDIGIISLYDKPYKELLGGGITSIDYNYDDIGEEIADLITSNRTGQFRAFAQINIRGSF
ncbi:GntR family transcriptional regulator [Chondrinema litorale]|uniref:GntR family transcriptional regulator n=1 Tax=Chondrinema litorale TaxID=2994555 RepID=UPI002542D2BD|nr:GntR family transcriptional regulator [Chondrinema litorale]UZR99231.1 GntR family transcriptional regulator [Chondrinema litorale]